LRELLKGERGEQGEGRGRGWKGKRGRIGGLKRKYCKGISSCFDLTALDLL
jgi:ribosomal protein L15